MQIISLSNAAILAQEIAKINCPSFVSVMNYTNKEGETSNYTVNLGLSYGNAKEHDFLFLLDDENFKSIYAAMPEGLKPYAHVAWNEMKQAAVKTQVGENKRSKAQTDAYIVVAPNLRVHKQSQRVFIYGFVVSKTVINPIVYPTVDSSGETLAKRHIGEYLKTTKFRQMAFDTLASVRVKGEELHISVTI